MREIERLRGLPEWRIYMQSCVSLRIHHCFLHNYWCWMLFAGTSPIQALNKFFHCGKPWGPTSTDAWMCFGIKSLFQSKNRSIRVTQCTLNHVWSWKKRAFQLHCVHVGPGCAKGPQMLQNYCDCWKVLHFSPLDWRQKNTCWSRLCVC